LQPETKERKSKEREAKKKQEKQINREIAGAKKAKQSLQVEAN
jgi:hypothetical protein